MTLHIRFSLRMIKGRHLPIERIDGRLARYPRFGLISPLLRDYRAARSARFLLWLMQNRVAGALRTGCFPATKDQPEFDLPQCNPHQPQLRPTVSRLLDGHHYFAMEA